MFDNLEDIVVHYDEIMAELAGGDVANDQNRFRKLMKEQSDLAPLVETYGEYKRAMKKFARWQRKNLPRERDLKKSFPKS